MVGGSESTANWDVIVVGAGAAGMMAAGVAARGGARVLVLEKNRKAGVKILMSGGTRCNLTHDTDAAGIMEAFGREGRFLRQALAALGPGDLVQWFGQLGVATKVESTGKVFPASDRALEVRDALQRWMVAGGTELRLGVAVRDVEIDAGRFRVAAEGEVFTARRVIVTSGGRSYPGCGTTGDGYNWLERLGHTIHPPRPALVPLVGGEAWTRALSGLTLPDVQVSVVPRAGKSKRPLAERRSSLLFTHFGFSGPAAMDVSGALGESDRVAVRAHLIPEWDAASAEAWFDRRRREGGRQQVANALGELLPRRLAEGLTAAVGLDPEQRMAELPAAAARGLVERLLRLDLAVTGTRGFEKAEVTAGGVRLKEVDPRSMASRVVPGLYIAGEILDLDGWIGGYNFQSAFSTGHVAGLAASRFESGEATGG